MGVLEETYRRSQGIEEKFEHKRVLYIASESYSAATVTVVQGLARLGFQIYTIQKFNINTWWCNKIIDKPGSRKFDFVLTSLGSGILWELYDKHKLHNRPKVLIDNMDNKSTYTWRDKYAFYRHRERRNLRPSEAILNGDLQPYCWYAPLGKYDPDVVFTIQKMPDDATFYLPIGMYERALSLYEGKPGHRRSIDFANLPGNGDGREKLTKFVAAGKLPGEVHNSEVWGRPVMPKKLERLVAADRAGRAHGYFRWVQHRNYFEMLNNTRIFIYPNVSHANPYHWDSYRIWEALSSGCLCLLESPNIDMAQYPVTELCPEMQFSDYNELVDKAAWLYSNPEQCERLRLRVHEGAMKFFAPVPLARYFLWRIWTEILR